MNNVNMLSEIVNLIPSDDQELIFDSPIRVKTTPHIHLFDVFGIIKNEGRICVMAEDGRWHELTANQINANYMLASILQRLKLTSKR